MPKPANRPNRRRAPRRGRAATILLAAGGLVASNPAVAGGTTAFLVTLGFISANALWYQPHVHDGVFFRTRPDLVFKPIKRDASPLGKASENSGEPADAPVRKVTSVPIPQSPDPIAAAINGEPVLAPGGDPEVAKLQQKLLALGLYTGTVDGISGKGTRAAIEAYRKAAADIGIDAEATVDQRSETTASIAVPAKKPAQTAEQPTVQKVSTGPAQNAATSAAPAGLSPADIVRVQAGLRAFGNDMVEIDGRVGASTKTAVSEFQRLFRLPVTGEPDAKLLAKMQEIGLIN